MQFPLLRSSEREVDIPRNVLVDAHRRLAVLGVGAVGADLALLVVAAQVARSTEGVLEDEG